MISVKKFLTEKKGEKAHRQAIAMGLKYKGFGYWVDPATGQVTHKTENDQLVEVDPEIESEKAGKDKDPAAGAAPSGGFGNVEGKGASYETHKNKQLPTGMGTNVQGIADNGMAQAPNTDNGRWEPGKDGDNYTTQDKLISQKVPVDSFVGKTNYYQWRAGKDGDNYTTLSYDDMVKRALNIKESDEFGMGKNTMLRKANNMQSLSPNDPSFVRNARDHIQAARQGSDPEAGPAAIRNLAGAKDTYDMAIKMDRLPAKMARRDERKQKVTSENEMLKTIVQDPNYDMSQKGELLGEGLFGAVYDSKDGKSVIKEGKLSPKELLILNKLKDVKAFPNLINAEVSTPFQSADDIYGSGSDSENEAMNDDSKGEGMRYFNDMPFADGKMAMSKINGYPYNDMKDMMTEEEKEQFMQKLWSARGAMHQLGISHNDMHGQNFFVDDAGNPGILDLGLANDDPLSALMEAIGGASGSDYQLDSEAKLKDNTNSFGSFSFAPNALRAKIDGNMGKLRETLMDKMQDYMDPDDEGSFDDASEKVEEVMRGGLRLGPDRLNDLRERLPFLEDNDTVLDLIKNFYDNVQDTETGQRMSNAYDQLQKDRATVATANLLRKRRGKEPIQDKLKDVLDPDD